MFLIVEKNIRMTKILLDIPWYEYLTRIKRYCSLKLNVPLHIHIFNYKWKTKWSVINWGSTKGNTIQKIFSCSNVFGEKLSLWIRSKRTYTCICVCSSLVSVLLPNNIAKDQSQLDMSENDTYPISFWTWSL